MPILPKKPVTHRSRPRALTLRLPTELTARLQARARDSGVGQGPAAAVLLSFALELEEELRDIEPELGWYSANRGVPLPRALAQLAARSLGIEPVDVYVPNSRSA
jgi:hypothetical protein